MGPAARLKTVTSHVASEVQTEHVLMPQHTSDPTGADLFGVTSHPESPDIDVFLDLCSVESYLSFSSIVNSLRGCRVHWHLNRIGAKKSIAVGMLREGSDHDSIKRRYQLLTDKTYAGLLGLPLELPSEGIDVSACEKALAYVVKHESPAVAEKLIRIGFAAVFDPTQQIVFDGPTTEQLVTQAGGNGANFAAWPQEDQIKALESERYAVENAAVWTTPFLLDRETGEAFIGESSIELLTLRLHRRGYRLPPFVHVTYATLPLTTIPRKSGASKLEVYIDLKSPYAFLAIEPTYALEKDFNVELVWRPYQLNIPSFLGSAEVGARDNKVKEGTNRRSPKQWLAVKYAYANCRRHAAERKPPLVIYGTQKIWNTNLACIAMLFAIQAGKLCSFQQRLWPPFWRRELDAENLEIMTALLAEAGVDTEGFVDFVQGEGAQQLSEIQQEADSRGVFGVPTYMLNGEMLFGREHLPLLRRRLFDAGCANHGNQKVLESPYVWTRNELFAGF